ncbi:DUF4349 domain-containing protein [Prochlorothrix hollandica]|uniref:DUF4349 domain-containing protein n=1 Tax=Prochlorothrix hollandica TaxID=1223 RepID=UPI000365B915|nr:DUF4349 domain-containing protein [Prochlorothrix hollandica]
MVPPASDPFSSVKAGSAVFLPTAAVPTAAVPAGAMRIDSLATAAVPVGSPSVPVAGVQVASRPRSLELLSQRRLQRSRQPWVWITLLGVGAIAACGAAPEAGLDSMASSPSQASRAELAPTEALAPGASDVATGNVATGAVAGEAQPLTAKGSSADTSPRAAPQLIKTAELNLEVANTRDAVASLVQQVRQQQGDVLQLEDQVPLRENLPHFAYVQVRVPQDRLDRTLEQLSSLGEVTQQRLSVEDVANQLVDFEARLRNLKKAEEMTLGIMERSGDVADILQVSQELARIREQIEQINGQLQRLQVQVAYSTINIYLTEPVASVIPPRGDWRGDLTLAWRRSTRSLGQFTQGLVVLAIWLVVYSPYWLVLGGGYLWLYRVLRRRSQP